MEHFEQATITFNQSTTGDDTHCYDVSHFQNVNVEVLAKNHSHGSSMVKLKNIVDYKWEEKNYPGHLIASHKDGKVIAYSINVNGQGMVRLIHSGINKRALIKGMSSELLDLEFAYLSADIVIGCIEETALHVHKVQIDLQEESLNVIRLLKIENPLLDHVPYLDKINWCPFVPELEGDQDDFSGLLLTWVRGSKYECYSIKTIIETYKSGVHHAKDLNEGVIKFYENQSLITNATFSPDGTTLAISTEDGYIRFYQIYFHESRPRCLHKWRPHDGTAISSFFFLDNHTQPIPGNTLWKYAITCAENNTEIKVSSCETWKTLQTISFKSSGLPLAFKAEMDKTSSYLVLSDMNNRQMYVLQILKRENDGEENGKGLNLNGNDDTISSSDTSSISSIFAPKVFVKSIAEFHLSSPILSYSICNAVVRKYKSALSDNYFVDEGEDYEDDLNNAIYCVVLRMFLVQPKSVQECHILYQPDLNAVDVMGTLGKSIEISPPSAKIIPEVSELTKASQRLTRDLSPIVAELKSPPHKPINLLTPDSFRSPVEKPVKPIKQDVNKDVLSTIMLLAQTNSSPGGLVQKLDGLSLKNINVIEEKTLLQDKMEGLSASNQPIEILASGGSSPSREVREILSLKTDNAEDEHYEFDMPASKNEAMKLLLEDFKNIDDDDDELSDDNQSDNESDEIDANKAPIQPIIVNSKSSSKKDWPKAPEVPFYIEPEEIPAPTLASKQIEVLSVHMTQIIEIMETQSRYIAELRNELYIIKNQNSQSFEHIKSTARMEETIKKSIEEHVMAMERRNNQKIENLMINKDKQQREMRDSFAQIVNNVVTTQLTDKLLGYIVSEFKRSLVPVMQLNIDNIRGLIFASITEKMSQYDQIIQNSLHKVLCTPSFVNVLGQSVFGGMHKDINGELRKTMEELLVPSYERLNREMFKELGKVFTEGTKEYTRAFEAYMKQYTTSVDYSREISHSMKQLPQQMKTINEQTLVPVFKDTLEDIRKSLGRFEAKMMTEVREQVKNEIKNGFERQSVSLEESVLMAVREHSNATPSLFDPQERIKTYLSHGEIDKAFHTALLANDLTIVEYCVENCEITDVFNPCRLEPTVLLSLIQQLSVEMNKYNPLKHKFVHHGILSINMHELVYRTHAPKVLRELCANFQSFIDMHPAHAMAFEMRGIVLMASSVSR